MPAPNTVLDIRMSGTIAASVALYDPLGSAPRIAAVWRLFIKPAKMPLSMCTALRAGVPSWS